MGLTTAGINYISQAVIGSGTILTNANAYIGVGDSSADFDIEQTDLQGTNSVRKGMEENFPAAEPPAVTFKSIFGQDEANFSWNEWGIFNAETGGTMLSRKVESNGTKLPNQTWILEVTITFAIGS